MTTIQADGPGPAGTVDAVPRFRLASPATATVLAVLVLILMAVALVLNGLVHQLSILGSGPIVPVVVVYAAVGFIVARRQPGNPIGWLLIGFILLFLLSSVVGWYAVLYYRLGHHGLPLAPVAVGGGALAVAEVLGLVVILVIWLSFVAHQVLSWRRASGEQRQQLKWPASGASVTVVVVAASFGISSMSVSGELLGLGLAALPVGIGVGILKYRL